MTHHRAIAVCVVTLLMLAGSATTASTASTASDPYCTGSYGGGTPRAGAPLRFGIDPGIAGSVGGAQLPSTPDDTARDVAAASMLQPPGRVLVVRLNRLFWSGGDALLSQFQGLVGRYTRAGQDVELQVRYHPGTGEAGDLAAWQRYVRHVVDVVGSNRRVVAMTITNEVNVTFSPNTSDGAYAGARDALIDGVEAAHDEALRRGDDQLRFGFTYAYRFSPVDDASFFTYLRTHGGSALQRALGFVGLDFYPGSVYPPAMVPGDTYRGELAQALGTVRQCLMPMAGLGPGVPIWITENGVPTGAGVTETQQAGDLTQLVDGAQAYSGTFNVTDYRWFNLRDSNSSGTGSLPGAAVTFASDGLLRDDYSAKPAFAAFRAAIAALGERETTPIEPPRCRRASLKLAHEPQRILAADLYLDRRRVAHEHGRDLHSIRLSHLPKRPFSVRIVLRLRGGRTVSYRRRFTVDRCRIVPAHRPRRGVAAAPRVQGKR